jgi:hypothetical protein
VHAVADEQDTPARLLRFRPGVDWTVHCWPSQRSASAAESFSPTAVHRRADVHDTADSLPGRGAGRMDHLRPFQRSASGTSAPALLVRRATAMHLLADGHDTLPRLPDRVPRGRGTLLARHLRPFQVFASGMLAPALLVELPTATHARAVAQDTPAS